MDYLVEAIILGIDSIIFITCVRNYYKNKNAMTMIQVWLRVTSNETFYFY